MGGAPPLRLAAGHAIPLSPTSQPFMHAFSHRAPSRPERTRRKREYAGALGGGSRELRRGHPRTSRCIRAQWARPCSSIGNSAGRCACAWEMVEGRFDARDPQSRAAIVRTPAELASARPARHHGTRTDGFGHPTPDPAVDDAHRERRGAAVVAPTVTRVRRPRASPLEPSPLCHVMRVTHLAPSRAPAVGPDAARTAAEGAACAPRIPRIRRETRAEAPPLRGACGRLARA